VNDLPDRHEPLGIHFVEQGEVYVVAEDYEPVRVLLKGNSFGESDIIKKASNEFLGDIRAGLRPVKTFFFSYADFKSRVSFPELVRLQEADAFTAQIDCAIITLSQKHNIDCELMR